jgi:hypothetical protein
MTRCRAGPIQLENTVAHSRRFYRVLHLGVAWGHSGDNLEDQILAFIVFISGLMLLELDCPEVWRSNSRLVLILGAGLVQSRHGQGALPRLARPRSGRMARFYFLSPCTFAPFLITLLLGTRAGLFPSCRSACSLRCSSTGTFSFLLVSLLAGFHRGLFHPERPQARWT